MNVREWITMFSGEDITIVRRADKAFQIRFALVGAFVLLVFLLCFGSCTYAIYSFFGQNILLAVTIGVFFGWMITNIYLLLLYTLTPNLLTEKDERTALISFLLRLGFIILLALIISRPVSVYVFERKLTNDVEHRKTELLGNHSLIADGLLIMQEKEALRQYLQRLYLTGFDTKPEKNAIRKIQEDSNYLSQATVIAVQVQNLPSGRNKKHLKEQLQETLFELKEANYQTDTAFMQAYYKTPSRSPASKADSIHYQLYQHLMSLLGKKTSSYEKLAAILDRSSFFIYKIKTITQFYPLGWFIDLGVLILFLLPVYWKYGERKLNRYYAQRRRIEKQLVIDEYQTFKHNYQQALKQATGLDIHFYETYEDPPFNTRKKSQGLELKPQNDLLKKLYAVD